MTLDPQPLPEELLSDQSPFETPLELSSDDEQEQTTEYLPEQSLNESASDSIEFLNVLKEEFFSAVFGSNHSVGSAQIGGIWSAGRLVGSGMTERISSWV